MKRNKLKYFGFWILCFGVCIIVLNPGDGLATGSIGPVAQSDIGHIWANEGGDKVSRDELRAVDDPGSVINSVWNGTNISLFGARNEVVGFNLVLEAPTSNAVNVDVSLTSLAGPGGASITTMTANGDGVFDYVGRNIELFYVRYLEIKGLSVDLAYNDYDERHIPERCRRFYDENGYGSGTWEDRPCHNKLYPDIAVPLEFHSPFAIEAGNNQSIWCDIYVPKSAQTGYYNGTIDVTESSELTWQIPIVLRVRDFELPDLPNARTMIYYSYENINDRYLGEDNMYPDPGTPEYDQSNEIIDRYFQMAHRHKLSLIDYGSEIDRLDDAWTARLNGDLFTLGQGYDGVGLGVGNGVFSIGTYGGWSWQEGTQSDMWTNTNPWVDWFDSQAFITPTDYFLYLIDESDDYPQIEQWAQWMDNNPGSGKRLMSMATIALPEAMDNTPSLDIPASGAGFGITSDWESAWSAVQADATKRFFMYNGSRPGSGSFAIEDDGVALRELAWGHYKVEADRWFFWESTYYVNFQCYGYHDPRSHTNLFQQAQTFGCYSDDDDSRGQAGLNYFNGDGVLFYPGTDTRYPEESYNVQGPLASLRIKQWRRGIQDVDYLTMAAAINPSRVAEIVDEMVPEVLWEYGVEDPGDPTWVLTDISWSTDPDDWEAARGELADIIEGDTPEPQMDKWSLWTGGTQLRGANIYQRQVYPALDGTDFLGPGPVGPPYTQSDFDNLAALGANYVNISHPGLYTEDPPYVLDQDIKDHLDNLLNMIQLADMFAVISFRTGPGRSDFTFYWDGAGDWFDESYLNDTMWQDQAAQDAWVAMWSYTAQMYQNNPIVVGYDLMVEPNSNEVGSHALNDNLDIWEPEEFYDQYGGTLYDWNQLYPRISTAIRQVDSNTPILIGGMGYSAVDWLPYLEPTGDSKTVYMVHQYAPHKYTHQEWDDIVCPSYPGNCDVDWDGVDEQFNLTWTEGLLTIIDAYKNTNSVPVSVNEFGLMRWVPDGEDFMNDQMDLFEQKGMNHALWVWDPAWEPWTEEVNAFNIRFGPNHNNTTNVSSDLLDIIQMYWNRNTVRPSGEVECQMTVTSPDSEDVWCVGESENIFWISVNAGNNVLIDYSTDAGSSWQSVVSSTSDDGSYSWTIPSAPSTNCLIRICDATDPSCCDTSQGSFQLCTCEPIELTTVTLPEGTYGCSYDEQLDATGGCVPYAWSIISGQLPGGLILNETSGIISGSPNEIGTFQFTVMVRDVLNETDEVAFAVEIGEYVNIKGDVDGNCNIDVLDAITAINIILGRDPMEEEIWRADCNGLQGQCDGDGVINILDVLKIVRIILGQDACP